MKTYSFFDAAKRVINKVLFISSFLLLLSTAYSQTGEVVICKGIDSQNDFVVEHAKEVSGKFIWYFMRDDFKPVGFDKGEAWIINLNTDKIIIRRFGCDKDTPCPYFEDELGKGVYEINVIVNGKLLGTSQLFEVR